MMARKFYWVQLLYLIRTLCKYINRWEGKLPTDLPAAVLAAFPYIRAACAALEAYDKDKAGGEIYPEEE